MQKKCNAQGYGSTPQSGKERKQIKRRIGIYGRLS